MSLERKIEEARRCAVAAAIAASQQRGCDQDVCDVLRRVRSAGTADLDLGGQSLQLAAKIRCTQDAGTDGPRLQVPGRTEGARILAKIAAANAVFDPASSTYKRPPPADPCPYPDPNYQHVGEGAAYTPYACFDRVIGIN
jgi:hypothetical protein